MLHCNQKLKNQNSVCIYCAADVLFLERAHFEKLPDSPITMKFHDNDDDNGGNNHNVMVLHLYLNLLRQGLYLCLYL